MSLPEEPRGPVDGQAVDERRAATVRRASDVWQRQLVDLSGRNRLLYYRDHRDEVEADFAEAQRASEKSERLEQELLKQRLGR